MGTDLPTQGPRWRREEIALLELVSVGYGNREIAYRLGVSVSAVKKRLSRLMRVLGVRSRAGLVRAALARGVISMTNRDAGM